MTSKAGLAGTSQNSLPSLAVRQTSTLSPAKLLESWHLLSLDAPTVAVLWTLFAAMVTHTKLPVATLVAMGLAVWVIYVLDRLLDARPIAPDRQANRFRYLELRHVFHDRHRVTFSVVGFGCVLCLAILLRSFPRPALHWYLIEGSAMAGYFVLIHAFPGWSASRAEVGPSAPDAPKELLVGPFFSIATFIPTFSRRPELAMELLPLLIFFMLLCVLNCMYIFSWEKQGHSIPHWTTAMTVRHLSSLTWCYVAFILGFSVFIASRVALIPDLRLYALACVASALLLLIMQQFRHLFSRLTLRAGADAALLTPLIIIPFLLRHRL